MAIFPLSNFCLKSVALDLTIYPATLVVLVLFPVEDRNKPLDEIEHRVYKKLTILIAATELLIGIVLKLMGMDNLFVAVVYSFVVLSFMLVAGKVKNH